METNLTGLKFGLWARIAQEYTIIANDSGGQLIIRRIFITKNNLYDILILILFKIIKVKNDNKQETVRVAGHEDKEA